MNILILSVNTGGGHMKAANVMKRYIEKNESSSKVKVVDAIEYINPMINKAITKGYIFLAKKTPKIYGKIYDFADGREGSLMNEINTLFSKKLMPLISEFNTDVIITTHPFTTNMISGLKNTKLINTKLICIITDYGVHQIWINKNVDYYITASDCMKSEMMNLGVKEEKIHCFGIPVDETFFENNNKDDLRNELNLKIDKPVILMMAGSFGVETVFKIYEKIDNIDIDFQIVIITGKNKKLYNSLKNISRTSKRGSILLYYTDNVYKYMQASDIIITKPGGLTVTEAMSCSLPMVLFDAIPGQEEKNAEFLVKKNMAIKIDDSEESIRKVVELLKNKEEILKMKQSCDKYKKINCSKNIYDLIRNNA